ncbi:MAG TPA: Hsp20/alpha crystallin family protein [Thermomicrobiaceae bacterium]|nr:Hsp20/alpha crystallin family protein [Thermomicrobiaceae bacterium]
MSTNRWDPWRDIVTLREAMNTLLEDSFVRPRAGLMAVTGTIPVDVKETEEEFVVYIPLPGIRPGDVEISILGDSLRVSGEFKDREPEDARWLVRERRFGQFERSFTLPTAVSADQATADFDAGILIIHLPKAEQARPKTIHVRAQSPAS